MSTPTPPAPPVMPGNAQGGDQLLDAIGASNAAMKSAQEQASAAVASAAAAAQAAVAASIGDVQTATQAMTHSGHAFQSDLSVMRNAMQQALDAQAQAVAQYQSQLKVAMDPASASSSKDTPSPPTADE